MKTFKNWLQEEHPLDEGWMKNLAVGATMLGAGIGCNGTKEAPSQPQPKKVSKFDFARRDAAELRAKANQLQQNGMKSGTFVQGELQKPSGQSMIKKSNKSIQSSSVTSDAAADF